MDADEALGRAGTQLGQGGGARGTSRNSEASERVSWEKVFFDK